MAKEKGNLQSLSLFFRLFIIMGKNLMATSVNLNIYEGVHTCLLLVRVLGVSTPL